MERGLAPAPGPSWIPDLGQNTAGSIRQQRLRCPCATPTEVTRTCVREARNTDSLLFSKQNCHPLSWILLQPLLQLSAVTDEGENQLRTGKLTGLSRNSQLLCEQGTGLSVAVWMRSPLSSLWDALPTFLPA